MRTQTHVFILFVFSIFIINISNLCAQKYTLCGSDTIIISLDNFQMGIIEWQESLDSIQWKPIDNEHDTVIKFFTPEEKYIRALVTTSLCDPVCTFSAFIQQKPKAYAGTNQKISGTRVILNGNFSPHSTGIWSVIDGMGYSLTEKDSLSSLLEGQLNTDYNIVWTLSNKCGSSADTVKISFIKNVFNTNFIIVDTTDIILSDSSEIGLGIYKIQFSEKIVGVNDSCLLLGFNGEGFLRKVLSYEKTNDSLYIFTTAQASIEDLIKEGVLNIGDNLVSDGSTLKSKSNYTEINHIPTRKELRSEPKFKAGTFIYEKTEIYQLNKGTKSTGDEDDHSGINVNFPKIEFKPVDSDDWKFKIDIDGNFKFIPNLVLNLGIGEEPFMMGIDNALIEKNYFITIEGALRTNIAEKDRQIYKKELYRKKSYKFCIIGGYPILAVTNFIVDLNCSFYGQGNLLTNFHIDKKTNYSAYIYYEDGNLGLNIGKSQSSNTELSEFSFGGEIGAEVELEPRVNFKIYGLAGPFISLPLKVNPKICAGYSAIENKAVWNSNIDVTLDGKIGCEAGFSKKLKVEISTSFNLFKTGIFIPDRLTITSGNSQFGLPGNKLSLPLTTRVTSNLGFGVPLVPVWFEIEGNNGFLDNFLVLTDLNGYAKNYLTLGNQGELNRVKAYTFNCNFDNLKTSPVYFDAKSTTETSPWICQFSSLYISFKVNSNNTVQPIGIMGIKPYTYSIDGITFSEIEPKLDILEANNKTFFIKDANGCIQSSIYKTLDPCSLNPPNLTISLNGNRAEAQGSSGYPPYLYSLDTGGSFTSQNTFNNLNNGKHEIHILDNKGCRSSKTFDLSLNNNSTLTDIDGNVYNTVTIGTQVWMAENLKTTKYNDGTAIPNVTDNTAWGALTTPSYCWYNNDATTYKATYGALYNWYTVNSTSNGGKNVCPTGWHVPTDAEWTTLTTYLGGESVAGGKLKETGTTHWGSLNTGATNETGFTALPGGYRDYDGTYTNIGGNVNWWSSTEYSTSSALYRYMFYPDTGVTRSYWGEQYGFSVRCVRDF